MPNYDTYMLGTANFTTLPQVDQDQITAHKVQEFEKLEALNKQVWEEEKEMTEPKKTNEVKEPKIRNMRLILIAKIDCISHRRRMRMTWNLKNILGPRLEKHMV